MLAIFDTFQIVLFNMSKLWTPELINTGDIDNPVSPKEAILNGYAPGNELYNFAEFPEVSSNEIAELKGQDYSTIFYKISKKLLGDTIPDEDLLEIAQSSYSEENFDFDEDDRNLKFTTTPTKEIIVGLSDGPTGSFKDQAMQPVSRLMSHLLKDDGRLLTILLSTSGDTGPAALNAFSGLDNIEIINMLPEDGVSKFQWSQMAELADELGVHVLEIAGAFTDINELHMKADNEYDLGTVNSVNIARIIAQVPYYFASYVKAIEREGGEIGDPVDVSIPSGNFGNALSAIIARKMGLPLRDIIVATNENSTLNTLIRTRKFELSKYVHTDSSAQDVEMPSNVWRYFGMMFKNDPEKIAKVYKTLSETGSVALKDIGIEDESVLQDVRSASINSDLRTHAMRSVYIESAKQIMIDPHTANGIAAINLLRANDPNVPMLTMETAKPFKFNEVMKHVYGVTPPRPERFANLEKDQEAKKLVKIRDIEELLGYIGTYTSAKAKK